MGACTFTDRATGTSAREAFHKAVDHAAWEHGHGGYTGTIAEKDSFVMITPQGDNAARYASDLLRYYGEDKIPEGYVKGKFLQDQAAVDSKWGPAGCINLGNGEFLFFGWASE